ncbi:MAG: hypothetical protein ACYCZJ_13220 [Sulfuriferula sp.]
MAVTSNQSGSTTPVIGTETFLGTAITAAGVYVLVLDTNAMLNGDTLVMRAYTKAKGASVSRIAYVGAISNIQIDPNKYSIPIPVDTEIKFSITQTTGTARAFDWNILSL